ncbi:MAG TPA: Hg(II)-responsive transcriptional regulator, partial [Gammaproteobacteria bacterium]|nr:Hg(II)-responsive transcriptional regulator [Gammaproteobacteria bacterium]
MNRSLTIGLLAQKAYVNIETVRYYQRIGLLSEPVKPAEGYRVYPATSINRIRFIKRAQQLGFSLQEISELLQLGDGECNDVRSRAEQKRTQIERQIGDLENLRKTLDTLITECRDENNNGNCPIIETLTDHMPVEP